MVLTIVLMGPSGCGESTVGSLLAKKLSVSFIEGDDFHSLKNKEKMSSGIPLKDEDRLSWLNKLREEARKHKGCCLACSALKKDYRDVLRKGDLDLLFVHLKGKEDLITKRIASRESHYMKQKMLESQFEILEELDGEKGFCVSIMNTPEKICEEIVNLLNLFYGEKLEFIQ